MKHIRAYLSCVPSMRRALPLRLLQTLRLRRLHLVRRDTLALHKQLWQILRSPISHGPPPVLDLERRPLLLALAFPAVIRGRLLSGWLLALLALPDHLLLCKRRLLGLLEHLVLDLVLIYVLLLRLVLQPDYRLHLPDVLLDHKQLVHEAQL